MLCACSDPLTGLSCRPSEESWVLCQLSAEDFLLGDVDTPGQSRLLGCLLGPARFRDCECVFHFTLFG